MTAEQQRIQELDARVNRLEREKSILKIPRGHDEATALLMSVDLKSTR